MESQLQSPQSDSCVFEPETARANGSAALARKAARSAFAMGLRQILSYGSNIAGGVILARLLTPAQFGFFALITFFLAFLNLFGGTGFAGNLIRTSKSPSLHEYRVVFTFQQIIVFAVFLLSCLVAPWIADLYHLHEDGAWFFRLVGFSLVVTSFMVIPQVEMERHLEFDKLAMIEALQAISFNGAAVILAWRGFGVLSFALALIVRATLGAILANWIARWKIGFAWDLRTLKGHVRFGLALQGGQMLSMLKDSITPLFVGLFLGTAEMGYATWSLTLASYSILVLMPLQRIYLPFFARLQEDPASMRRFVESTLWIVNAVAAPLVILTIALAHPITILIFGAKWLPALPVFYLFSAGSFLSPCCTPMMSLLNALGKSHVSLLLIATWMVLTWVLGVPLIMLFGLTGFGLAMLGVQLANLILYRIVRKQLGISPWPSFWPSWPIALLMGGGLFALQRFVQPHNIAWLGADLTAGLVVYLLGLWFTSSTRIKGIVRLRDGMA